MACECVSGLSVYSRVREDTLACECVSGLSVYSRVREDTLACECVSGLSVYSRVEKFAANNDGTNISIQNMIVALTSIIHM